MDMGHFNFFLKFLVLIFPSIPKIRWTKSEQKQIFWYRWVFGPCLGLAPVVPVPQPQTRGGAPGYACYDNRCFTATCVFIRVITGNCIQDMSHDTDGGVEFACKRFVCGSSQGKKFVLQLVHKQEFVCKCSYRIKFVLYNIRNS